MLATMFYLIIMVAFFTLLYFSTVSPALNDLKPTSKKSGSYLIMLAAALVLRVIAAPVVDGHLTDMNCWRAWSQQLNSVGIREFYSSDMWCDYPPGYMYILYIVGIIVKYVQAIPDVLLFKLPAIISDVVLGLFIYKLAMKKLENVPLSTALAIAYLFNPAILVNSTIWGQVDAFFTLFLMLSIFMLAEEKYMRSAIWLGICVLVKPQALMFCPIYLFVFINKLITTKESAKWILTLAKCVGISLLVVIVGVIPFSKDLNPLWIIDHYTDTVSSYANASVNAYNLYAFLGYNYEDVMARFLGISFLFWGWVAIFGAVGLGGYLFLRAKEDTSRLFYIPAMIMTIIFTFSSMMHERYLFPVLAMYLAAFIIRRDKRILGLFAILSVQHYCNVAHVLVDNINRAPLNNDNLFIAFVSFVAVVATLYSIYLGMKLYLSPTRRPARAATRLLEGASRRLSRKDYILLFSITAIYAVVALVNLGDNKAPQNGWRTLAEESVVVDFGAETDISRMQYFNALGQSDMFIQHSLDDIVYTQSATFETQYCFTWYSVDVNTLARYVKITAKDADLEILELGFFDTNNNLLAPAIISGNTAAFDEQQLVPSVISYKNSMYFDEIYHGRTAFENLNFIEPYENTHPPLGKLIIALGIKLFGMNPFGWRFMGALFGALMLPLIYLFAKRLFARTQLAFIATFLMAFDFMHFAQTRISTIDTYAVFFIILMYYFMYRYYEMSLTEESFSKTLTPLLLCGISFGLAAASKWIGIYAGLGILALFVICMVRRYRQLPGTFSRFFLKTCLWCILFFILIPAAIYAAAYIPIMQVPSHNMLLERLWGYQAHMFKYHAGLTDTHGFSSLWFRWPIMTRPVWFYMGDPGMLPEGTVSSIVSMGNPFVWWATCAAIPFLIWLAFKKVKDRRITFILVAFASQYAPWIVIGRVVFLYHFFASLPFVVFAISYLAGYVIDNYDMGKRWVYIYGALAAVAFVCFYPVLSGVPVYRDYVLYGLKWFSSWLLCS